MANRFFSPSEQFANSAGVPYAGGSLQFYASGTSTPLGTFSDQALSVANTNPVALDSAGRAGAIFLTNAAYKVVLSDALANQIYTADPVYASDFSATAQFAVISGSPQGVRAGTAGSGTIPSSSVWDSVGNVLYICTTTGVAAAAVWTAVNTAPGAAVIDPPRGYLTPTSGTPIITGDVIAQASLVYTPYVGNAVPIYNGAAFTPVTFAELTLNLVAAHAGSTIYDVFAFNNASVITLCTGPAWSTSTAGAGARGSGAGTTQLARVNGILVNAVSMTGRNGSTTFGSIGANLATYLGSILIDAAGGTITCHRTVGQSRKWGIWNAYNRAPITLQVTDATAAWNYSTNTVRASNGASANSMTIFSGLAEELYTLSFAQNGRLVAGGGNGTSSATIEIGIGFNSIVAFIANSSLGRYSMSSSGLGTTTQNWDQNASMVAGYLAPPSLGINTVTACEICTQNTSTTSQFTGTAQFMSLGATWRG